MIKYISCITLLLAAIPTFAISLSSPAATELRFYQLLDEVRFQLQDHQVPGASLAVVSNSMIYAQGIGITRRGNRQTVNSDTQFFCGSTSKMLTAAAIMSLVDEGLLDLHAPITDYVPYFKLGNTFDPSRITVHQLLTHTSGLPDQADIKCSPDPKALTEWFRKHTDLPLWSPPARLFNYSNLGYCLLGLTIEETSGLAFNEAMQQRLFRPLGMTGADFDLTKVFDSSNYAFGHSFSLKNLQIIDPADYNCAVSRPAGLLYTRAKDLAYFAAMLLDQGGNVLSRISVEEITGPHADTRSKGEFYGYGLWSFDYNGLQVFRHNGGIDGFLSDVWIVPALDFAIVILLNADSYDPSHIARSALNIFFNLSENPAPDFNSPPGTWEYHTGNYYDPNYFGKIEVYQDQEQRLWVKYGENNYRTELLPQSGDVFSFDWDESPLKTRWLKVTFFPDPNGRSEYFATRRGVGKRIELNN